MKTIGNFIWIITGGWLSFILGSIITLMFFISIIGIPWGRAFWVITKFMTAPFGKQIINRKDLTQQEDIGTSGWGTTGNVIWFVLIGWWAALLEVISGVILCVTIIGIPFGIQRFKFAGLWLAPIGKTIVPNEVARLAVAENARTRLAILRSPA